MSGRLEEAVDALPALHRHPPDRGGPHVPRLGAQLPGAPRRRDRRVQDRHRGGSGLRQPLQRHRRLPDRAGPRGRGDRLARAREEGAPRYEPRHYPYFNLARVYIKQHKIREAIRELEARGRHRAALHDRPAGAAPAPRPAQLSALPLPFYDNPLLFGRDGTRGLLAFAPTGDVVRV